MGPRQFRRKEKVIGDRSVWTDTPQDKARKEKVCYCYYNKVFCFLRKLQKFSI